MLWYKAYEIAETTQMIKKEKELLLCTEKYDNKALD